jgi:hypothetical protein
MIFSTIQIHDVQSPGSTTLTLHKTDDFHGKFNNFLHYYYSHLKIIADYYYLQQWEVIYQCGDF